MSAIERTKKRYWTNKQTNNGDWTIKQGKSYQAKKKMFEQDKDQSSKERTIKHRKEESN